MTDTVLNTNIVSMRLLPTPQEVCSLLPSSETVRTTVMNGRETVRKILDGTDPRKLLVVGPCSIHDPKAALEYANRLNDLSKKVSSTFFTIMRVYFEKPRTVVGWKGYINDPDLDDTFKIDEGLRRSRKMLLEIGELGLPTGSEALDPITPQYLTDLLTWMAIGARTTESQTHREMASGLSTPVGIKNGMDGSVEVAINALKSVSRPHHFLGVTMDGRSAVFQTAGNKYGHVVLRGGGSRPNYDSVSVALCEEKLRAANLPTAIMIDCSHGNSLKQADRQPLVLADCVMQVMHGTKSIKGFMLESNLEGGNQEIPKDLSQLRYGVSITDACLDWKTTERIILESADRLAPVVSR